MLSARVLPVLPSRSPPPSPLLPSPPPPCKPPLFKPARLSSRLGDANVTTRNLAHDPICIKTQSKPSQAEPTNQNKPTKPKPIGQGRDGRIAQGTHRGSGLIREECYHTQGARWLQWLVAPLPKGAALDVYLYSKVRCILETVFEKIPQKKKREAEQHTNITSAV